jgi:hypothetical protein
MAPQLTTEQKTRIVEWFLLQIRLSQSSAGSKTSTSARKHQQGIRWKRGSFAQLGIWQARKEAGASHVFALPTLLGPFMRLWPHLQHGSLCDSLRKWGIAFDSMAHTSNRSTHASVQDPCLPVYDNGVPRKVDKVCRGVRWSLAAEPSHSGTHLVLNPCDYFFWGYLKDKVFSSAPRTLPELKERIKESCAQVTRGMLTRVVQNFVLRLQAVWESQGAQIEHVTHNATHMWNSNPCLLLWHCFHIDKFAIASALLSWKWQ